MNIIYKRLLASFVDLGIYIIFTVLSSVYLSDIIGDIFDNYFFSTADLFFYGSFLYIFFIHEVLFAKSIGKWLLNLKIVSMYDGQNFRIRLIFRALVKFMFVVSFFGAIANIAFLLVRGISFYDSMFNLYVVENENNSMTRTQKNWQKHFR